MIKGSYSALNCYYLSLIDTDFAKQQFQILKKYFKKTLPLIAGIKEYHAEKCLFGFDIDAGPIIFGLSPSGTGFAIGTATMCNDSKFRKQLLRTAEREVSLSPCQCCSCRRSYYISYENE